MDSAAWHKNNYISFLWRYQLLTSCYGIIEILYKPSYLAWCKHQFPAFMLSCTRATQIYNCFLIMFVLRSVYIWITSIKFLVLAQGMSGALCWHHGSQGLGKLCACRSEYFCNQKGGEVSIECCFWYINTSHLTEVGRPLRQVTLLWTWRTFFFCLDLYCNEKNHFSFGTGNLPCSD
jgi:hypothetical protein